MESNCTGSTGQCLCSNKQKDFIKRIPTEPNRKLKTKIKICTDDAAFAAALSRAFRAQTEEISGRVFGIGNTFGGGSGAHF